MGIFEIFKNFKKPNSESRQNKIKETFENLTESQKRNASLITMISYVSQLIDSDGKITKEEKEMFVKFKRTIESKIIPDNKMSVSETGNSLSNIVSDDALQGEIIRQMPQKEIESFFEYLISFAMVDKEFAVEEANFIGEILKNIYPEKDNNQLRELINELLSKYSDSNILSELSNKSTVRYSNGNVRMELQYKEGSEDILEGPFKEFHINGVLKREGEYKNNKWNGRIKEYNINGNLEDDAMMINGLENGDAFTYYGDEKETLKQHAIWKDGKLNGLIKVFDEDGNLSLEQIYSNGDATGKFKKYFKDGVISHEGYKEKGELKGIAKVFWETGELQVELNYDSNSMKTYTKDGQLYSEKTFEE
jgi:antitoxin component YwqK of YwqJK toxin-antitoxin module